MARVYKVAAGYLASLPATRQHTFGLKRSESLAALFSMLSLAFVSIGLAYEAVRRLLHPPSDQVDGPLMSSIAAIGVFVNVVLAYVLGGDHIHMPGAHDSHGHSEHSHSYGEHNHGHQAHAKNEGRSNNTSCKGHEHNHNHNHDVDGQNYSNESNYSHESDPLIANPNENMEFETLHADELVPDVRPNRNINLQAAYLHVMGDLAQSVAVLIAGLVIWVRPDYQVIDPICTLLFCTLVFVSTLRVVRSAIAVLLEEVPPNISWKNVYDSISSVPEVRNVHDLHIWCISHGEPTLSVHCFSANRSALSSINDVCKKFGIKHATIQIQEEDGPCITCSKLEGCTTQGMMKSMRLEA